MDTDNWGYNLNGNQFGQAYFRDFHEKVGMAEPQPGAIFDWYAGKPDMTTPQPTGKRVRISTDAAIVPNQTHVQMGKVNEYVKKPSGNPIAVVKNPVTDQYHVLDGHHRVTANRLRGKSTRAEIWE